MVEATGACSLPKSSKTARYVMLLMHTALVLDEVNF
jgi:hypothetical protein